MAGQHYQRVRSARFTSIVIAMATAMAAAVVLGPNAGTKASPAKPPEVRSAYGNLPLSFEENRGQTDARVKFLARGGGYSLFLTPTEAVLKLRAPSSAQKQARIGAMPIAFRPARPKEKFSTLRITLEGANPRSVSTGVDPLPGRSNYFLGKDPKQWRRNLPTFAGVKFREVYPGIDLVYRGAQGRLEYDFMVAPHADPSRIKMIVDGAEAIAIDRDGNLVIKTSGGEVIQKAPGIYQDVAGAQLPVKGGYVLIGKNSAAFRIGAYNSSEPLIIDPLLTYVSYLGGGGDSGTAIAVDATGAALVTGTTTSTNFPVTTNPLQSTNFGQTDVFVSKISPDGTSLVYSTYLGGTADDSSSSIAVDPMGNAYLTGVTFSADYPISDGAYQSTFTGQAAFVTALDPSGGLIYSTFLGQDSAGSGIAVDSAGDAWVIGPPGFIPTTSSAFQQSCQHIIGAANGCLFLTEFNPEGTALVYSTLFGGGDTIGTAVALDAAGEIFIAGIAGETLAPDCGEFLDGECAFLAKFNGSASSLISSMFFPSLTLLKAPTL